MDKAGQIFRSWIIPHKSILLYCAALLVLVWSGNLWRHGGASLLILYFAGYLVVQARRHSEAERKLQESYDHLAITHEDLISAEEELRTNYNELNNERIFINAVLESIPGLFYLYDVEGRLLRWNKNHETMTGYSAGELSTMTLPDWYQGDEENLNRVLREVEKAFQDGVAQVDAFLQTKGGGKIPFYFTAVKMVIDAKAFIVGTGIDITDQKKAQEELQEKDRLLQGSYDELSAAYEELTASEEELRSLYDEVVNANAKLSESNHTIEEYFNAAADGFVVNDVDTGEIVAINRKITEMFGYSEEEFLKQGIVLISTPAHVEDAMSRIRRTLYEESQLYEREAVDRHGRRIILEIKASPVIINGKRRCLAILRDITSRKQMEERIEFLSLHDPLTGANNRSYFEEEILRLQTKKDQGVGIFICDVDGLKLINDTLGHRQGDELLRRVVELLQEGVQKPNFIARIGGDEFAVVLLDPTRQQAEQLEQHYQSAVIRYNVINPQVPISLSIGWAISENGADTDAVFKEADHNMYRQKMHQSQSVRGSIVQTLMKALEAKDDITEGHAERMGELMETMGRKLALPQGAIADLWLFAKFHDIGKVGIPDSILKKPSSLTEEEMAVMRRHCEIGFRIARSSPDLAPIADWVLKHQEHWDGNGYPLGISGGEIPIQCRMLGIVDAYDAMTRDRPYRKAMPREDAIAEIIRCSGSQFDPDLATMFVELIGTPRFS